MALIVEPIDTGSIAVSSRRRGRLRPIGRFTVDSDGFARLRRSLPGRLPPVLLRIAPSHLLSRELVLPMTAEADLADALHLAIDSLTPFTADEVFWDWQIMARDRARNQLRVRLDVVPRAALPLAGELTRCGLAPSGFEIPLSAQGSRDLWLRRRTVRFGLADRMLAGCCAALLLLAIVVPFAIQAHESAAVQTEMEALRAPMRDAAALRRRIDPDGATDGPSRRSEALRLIAAVTDAMPDDTFLTELTLHDRTISLTGQSSDAAGLIARMAARSAFHKPSFTAPVTRAANGRADIFALQAEIAP